MWWEKYVGLPFVELGRGPVGYDCWGLVRLVYQEQLGIELPSWTAHKSIRDKQTVSDELTEAHKLFIKTEAPEPLSVVLMSSTVTLLHVGIAIDRQSMLHTTLGKDACVGRLKTFEHQIKGFYRYHDQNCRPPEPPRI